MRLYDGIPPKMPTSATISVLRVIKVASYIWPSSPASRTPAPRLSRTPRPTQVISLTACLIQVGPPHDVA